MGSTPSRYPGERRSMYPDQNYFYKIGRTGPYLQPTAYPVGQRGYQQTMPNPYVYNQDRYERYDNPYNHGNYGPNSGHSMPHDQHSQRLNQVAQQYNIHPQFAARLHALSNYEVVILCDDSTSMNTPIHGTNQTRWDELKSIVNIVVDITAVTDSNGVDVYFLNREPMLNVTDGRYTHQAFSMLPQGLTPLVPALRKILAAKYNRTPRKRLLILVATDGAPTNAYGQTDIHALENVLRNELQLGTYVTFLACTDDLQAMNYLSGWDRRIPNVDVMDDYHSERAEIHRTRGPNFPFSFGDYIVKSLLGSIDPWFDSMDDRAYS